MTTWTALTTLTGKGSAEALGLALENLFPEPTGVGVFEVEDGSGVWEVGGYFIEKPDLAGLALLATMHGAKDFVVSEIPETDWVAHVRRELAPVEAGRFFVHGAHDTDKLPENKVGLLIEAAMAFGTGHHGTTKGCLLALDSLIEEGFQPRNVADIGCGTAVLAMASTHFYKVPTLASDIDPVAIDVAIANLAVNNASDSVKCVVAAGFDHEEIRSAGPYDLVFANILKGPLIDLSPDMAKNINSGGKLVVSGVLNHQAEEVRAVYATNGFNHVRTNEIGEWSTTIFDRK